MRGLYSNIIASSYQTASPSPGPSGINFADMTHTCDSNAEVSTTQPFIVYLPASIQVGDLIFAFIESDMLYSVNYVITTSGWTQEFNWYGSTSDNAGWLWWKIADSSDVASGQLEVYTTTKITRDFQAWTWIAEGVDTTTPISDVGTWTESAGVSKTIAGITPSANGLAVAFWGYDGGDGEPTTITSGTGWTKLQEQECDSSIGGTFAGFASKTSTSGVATGDITVTALVSDGWGGVMVNFKQA